MRKLLTIGLALTLVVGIGASASGEQVVGICLRATTTDSCGPKLEFNFNASIAPYKLPKHELTPVALRLEGSLGHDDGSQPSALREMVLDVDKDLQFNAGLVPACQTSARAIRSLHPPCQRSTVGEGQARIAISSLPEPATVHLTLLNGGIRDGKRLLYIYSVLNTPVPTPLVAVAAIERKGKGLQAVIEIPKIAESEGSILDFHLTIHRLLMPGKQHGYLEARCPDRAFKIELPKILFRNDAQAPNIAPTTQLKATFGIPCVGRNPIHSTP